jgi:hypothetical protein
MDKMNLKPYHQSADKAIDWLSCQLQNDGSYGANIRDLASYYKSPYLFYVAGKLEAANCVLSHIKKAFMQADADFSTSIGAKSENAAFHEYWAYPNAWIALAAQKMGRFDVAYPAYHYLKSFYHPQSGGFTTHRPTSQPNTIDILTTAHLGLTALYLGELEKAKRAGALLQTMEAMQPNRAIEFLLRQDENGQLITQYPQAMAIFFSVSATQPNQAYFMIGYPIAFLAKLYRATSNLTYLETAKRYLEFAMSCQGNLRTFHFSHKIAWGAAMVANLTQETQCAEFATAIADYLVSIQDPSGAWLQEEPAHTSFDQTAEIAIWLKEISAEISEMR